MPGARSSLGLLIAAIATIASAPRTLAGCSSSDEGGASSGGAAATGGGAGDGSSSGGSSSCGHTEAGCDACLVNNCAAQLGQCQSDTQCNGAKTTFVTCAATCKDKLAMCGSTFVTAGGSRAIDLWSCAKTACAGPSPDKCGE